MRSSPEDIEARLRTRLAAMIGAPVTDIRRMEGGANNQVYRVSTGKVHYAAKLYPTTAGDARDRFAAETAALRFLNGKGLHTVPGIVASDGTHRIGLYEWIEGERVEAASERDVAAAVALLSALHALRKAESAPDLPLASEACLSGAELVAQVEHRLARLRQVAPEHPALGTFIEDGLAPTLIAAKDRAERLYAGGGQDFDRPLAPEQRSLSPSDFGFHNALRKADGTLVFYDFEYFGWDDPVKPVADFVLHPGMTMAEPQRRFFVAEARKIYDGDAAYGRRLDALFPLFALRWCLILLNEFLPERWARRIQAGVTLDRATVIGRQATKARATLEMAKDSMVKFPYGN